MNRIPADRLTQHPASAMFPLAPDSVVLDLAASIRANGQLSPVLVDDQNRVIDGWTRARAIARLNEMFPDSPIDVITERVTGDAISMSLDANLERRAMSASQRAMFAARLVSQNNFAVATAASRSGTSVRSTQRAMQLDARNARLANEVLAGRLSLFAATVEAGLATRSAPAAAAPAATQAPQPEPVTAVEIDPALTAALADPNANPATVAATLSAQYPAAQHRALGELLVRIGVILAG